jgi:hypothetical protein
MRRICVRVAIRHAVNRHPLVIYLAVAFLISWSAVLWVIAQPESLEQELTTRRVDLWSFWRCWQVRAWQA